MISYIGRLKKETTFLLVNLPLTLFLKFDLFATIIISLKKSDFKSTFNNGAICFICCCLLILKIISEKYTFLSFTQIPTLSSRRETHFFFFLKLSRSLFLKVKWQSIPSLCLLSWQLYFI